MKIKNYTQGQLNLNPLFPFTDLDTKQNDKQRLCFENIIKILKTLKSQIDTYPNKDIEKKILHILPYIYKECSINYVHLSCILYHFNKLNNSLSKESKKQIFNEFSRIFEKHINNCSIKESTIILKCLLDNQIKNETLIYKSFYKCIYYLLLDILYKKKESYYSILLSFVYKNFKNQLTNFFELKITNTIKEPEITQLYNILYNVKQYDEQKIIFIVSNCLATYKGETVYNLRDVVAFLSLLSYHNLNCMTLYLFLAHMAVATRLNLCDITQEDIEETFWNWEKGGRLRFEAEKQTSKTNQEKIKKKEENIKEEIVSEEPQNDVLERVIVKQRNALTKQINLTNASYSNHRSEISTNDKLKEEEFHSLSLIIFISITKKRKNKFIYLLSNHLLLNYIKRLNLIDICNILELFIYHEQYQKNSIAIFERMKQLIAKEKNEKTFPICCISILKIKNELNTDELTKVVISLFKCILQKKYKNSLVRENIVIFVNISNFMNHRKIPFLFFLYYIQKIHTFVQYLVSLFNTKTNAHNTKSIYDKVYVQSMKRQNYEIRNSKDILDLLKTFLNIYQIYEHNNFYINKQINVQINFLTIIILKFLKGVYFQYILSPPDQTQMTLSFASNNNSFNDIGANSNKNDETSQDNNNSNNNNSKNINNSNSNYKNNITTTTTTTATTTTTTTTATTTTATTTTATTTTTTNNSRNNTNTNEKTTVNTIRMAYNMDTRKLLNSFCYYLSKLHFLINKMSKLKVVNTSNQQLASDIFSDFKKALYKKYHTHLLNEDKKKCKHIFYFVFHEP